MEKYKIEWILGYVGHEIDIFQYGSQKGNSATHYLIEFVNFNQYNTKNSETNVLHYQFL